jgi:hypothetical protein
MAARRPYGPRAQPKTVGSGFIRREGLRTRIAGRRTSKMQDQPEDQDSAPDRSEPPLSSGPTNQNESDSAPRQRPRGQSPEGDLRRGTTAAGRWQAPSPPRRRGVAAPGQPGGGRANGRSQPGQRGQPMRATARFPTGVRPRLRPTKQVGDLGIDARATARSGGGTRTCSPSGTSRVPRNLILPPSFAAAGRSATRRSSQQPLDAVRRTPPMGARSPRRCNP